MAGSVTRGGATLRLILGKPARVPITTKVRVSHAGMPPTSRPGCLLRLPRGCRAEPEKQRDGKIAMMATKAIKLTDRSNNPRPAPAIHAANIKRPRKGHGSDSVADEGPQGMSPVQKHQ